MAQSAPPGPPRAEPGKSPRCVALLPARLGSTRLPRKMLLRETGLPLIVHTARNVAGAAGIERTLVATDSEEVRAACAAEGVEAVLTSPEHRSGTDRIREAYLGLGTDYEVVLNVQGDEPDVAPEDLSRLCAAFTEPAVEVATLAGPAGADDAQRPSVVKVVLSAQGNALYFSRAAIPSAAHARQPEQAGQASQAAQAAAYLRHIGVYAFRPEALARFCELPESSLERTENLEQLRWLEAGGSMRVLVTRRVPHGIDTHDDYEAFVRRTGNGAPSGNLETR